MIGLGILLFLCIWAATSLLIANLIGKNLLKRFTKDAEGRTTGKGVLIILLLSVLMFFAPIADEIISYPAYYQMCQNAGKYEYALGMDAKKAFGRQYYTKFENEKLISLFPWFREIKASEIKPETVLVKDIGLRLIDENTNETILTSRIVVPVSSLFAIPWDGKRITWLLHSCTTENKKSNDLLTDLHLIQVYKFE